MGRNRKRTSASVGAVTYRIVESGSSDAAPAALRELRGQQRAVEDAIEFVPIAARNRAR